MNKKKTLKPKGQTTTGAAKPAIKAAAAAPVIPPTPAKPTPVKAPTETAPKAAPTQAPKTPVAPAVTTAPKAVATPKPEPAKPAPAKAAPVIAVEAPKAAPAPKPEQPKTPPAKAFELEAPQASKVLLAGDFTGWDAKPIAMSKEGNGSWKTRVSLAPGSYQYRFIVDGNWTDDPQAPSRITNPFGTVNCVCEVSAN